MLQFFYSSEIVQDHPPLHLWHGSKGGIVGKIKPKSSHLCDFGNGFYMGDTKTQPATLICARENPVLYKMELDVNGLKTLRLDGLTWALFIAVQRRKMARQNCPALWDSLENLVQSPDLIVGKIADDRLFFVLDQFFQNIITDTALMECMQVMQFGTQYVAKTEKACSKIKIFEKVSVTKKEWENYQILNEENRKQGVSKANLLMRQHRRDGRYFDELLEEVTQDGFRLDTASAM